MATVHAEVATSHETAGIAKQEHRGATILLRTGKTAEHIFLRPLLAALRELHKQFLYHRSDDIARRDGIDANIVSSPFSREISSKLENGGFASVVSGTNQTLQKTRQIDIHDRINGEEASEKRGTLA